MIYYVDRSQADNLNSGSSEGAAKAVGIAAVTDGTATVLLDADTDLSTVVVGDSIRINGRTDGIRSTDIFEITAVDDEADSVDVTPSPGAGVDQVWRIGGAFQLLQRSFTLVNDADKVWVKGGTDYTEACTISLAVANTDPVVFEGYTTTPGDGGTITINGSGARAAGIVDSLAASTRAFYVFKNFRMTGHTANGVNTDTDYTCWKNCQFSSNTGNGMTCQRVLLENCKFEDNTARGLNNTAASVTAIGCRFYRNGTDGALCSGTATFMYCTFFSNGSIAISGGAANDLTTIVINCTIDGDNGDTTVGINLNTSFRQTALVVNTVVYDCATGISSASQDEWAVSRSNLLFSNDTTYVGFDTFTDEVLAAPQFLDEANQDYRPASGSPLIGAGYDSNILEGRPSSQDIGSFDVAGASGANPPFYPLTVPGQ